MQKRLFSWRDKWKFFWYISRSASWSNGRSRWQRFKPVASDTSGRSWRRNEGKQVKSELFLPNAKEGRERNGKLSTLTTLTPLTSFRSINVTPSSNFLIPRSHFLVRCSSQLFQWWCGCFGRRCGEWFPVDLFFKHTWSKAIPDKMMKLKQKGSCLLVGSSVQMLSSCLKKRLLVSKWFQTSGSQTESSLVKRQLSLCCLLSTRNSKFVDLASRLKRNIQASGEVPTSQVLNPTLSLSPSTACQEILSKAAQAFWFYLTSQAKMGAKGMIAFVKWEPNTPDGESSAVNK